MVKHWRLAVGTRSVKRVLRSVLPGPPRFHANFAAPRLIPFLIQQLSPGSVILNLGSGQGVADVDLEALWFSAHYWVNIDLIAHNGATCVADAHQIPLADSSCDLVINQAVLEHVLDPGQVVSEMRRVLRPGGCIYCEVPFLQPYHPSPMDFQRYTLDGIRQLFQDWEELEAGIVAGPGNAVRKILIGWVS